MAIQKGETIGPFRILEPLSNDGGMSNVYLACEIERPKHYAALKVQLTEDDHSAVYQDLIRQETQYLQALRHPGIVRIFPLRIDNKVAYVARASEQKDQPWYYAMEYIPGDSLEAHTRTIKKYPVEWALELFYQILTTVHYMHKQGYAHCDLKPQNILFRYTPNPNHVPTPILVDFGSATHIKEGIRQLAASVRYSPPEVITALDRGDIPVNELKLQADKIDIWALGAVLFEIITGRPLINRHHRKEITTTILRGELDTMSELRPEVHNSLDKLLEVMLRRVPSERPDTDTLIEAIETRISSIRPPRISMA